MATLLSELHVTAKHSIERALRHESHQHVEHGCVGANGVADAGVACADGAGDDRGSCLGPFPVLFPVYRHALDGVLKYATRRINRRR